MARRLDRLNSAARHMDKFLIITADDFGLHEHVNDAVERAHRGGVLSAASLMMAGPAVADAIERARRMPTLRVGLHLVLADGRAVLAPAAVSDLADSSGHMDARMFVRGMRYFALPRVRRQLEAEIHAQYAAFARTGLELDHVNVHKHFHMHPTVLDILLRIGRDFGVSAVRVPSEPLGFTARRRAWGAVASGVLLMPSVALMKRRLHRAGVAHNDHVFGLSASGAMDETALLTIVKWLPRGVTEIYLHPATVSGAVIAPSMPTYRHADELAALTSPTVRAAIGSLGVRLGGYQDFFQRPTLHAA